MKKQTLTLAILACAASVVAQTNKVAKFSSTTMPTGLTQTNITDNGTMVGVGAATPGGTNTFPGAIFHANQATQLGQTAGNNTLLARMSGNAGYDAVGGNNNELKSNLWLIRKSDAVPIQTSWQSAALHDAISIDATAYGTPGVDTRTFWERNPFGNKQSWGTANTTYMMLNGSNFGIGTGTNTLSARLEVSDNGGTNRLRIYGNAAGDMASTGSLSPYFASGAFNVYQGAPGSGTLRMQVAAGGNTYLAPTAGNVGIGVGTGTLTYKLQVGDIISSAKTGRAGYQLYNGGAISEWFIGQESNTSHNFKIQRLVSGTYTNVFDIDQNGQVGIGTATPKEALQIGGTMTFHDGGVKMFAYNFDYDGADKRIIAAPFAGMGFNGTTGDIFFTTAPTGAAGSVMTKADRMVIYNDGRVRIGAQVGSGIHADAKLSVDGKLLAKSMYVNTTTWADYVFADNYELPKLSDVEAFYKEHKHLPEVPSEKEVLENGIDVAEMNKLLLKKMEEMTLYMVQLQKEVEALKK